MQEFKVSGYMTPEVTVTAANKREAAAKAAAIIYDVKPEAGEEVKVSDLGGRGFDCRVTINPQQARVANVLYVDRVN